MRQNLNLMKRIIWTYGIIAGSITVLMLAISIPFMDSPEFMERGELLGYATMLVALSLIFFGVRTYRDRHLGGAIPFKRAFFVGLYISLVASAIYVIGWMVISGLFLPDFAEQYAQSTLQQMESSGATAEEIAKHKSDMAYYQELYKNPLFKAGITFTEIFPVGLIVTIISAIILKKN